MRILIATSIVCLLVVPAHAKYTGGAGTAADPYQIATAQDLIDLGETPEDYDKHFILTSDIDLSGRTLADLILDRDTDLTHLPWVNRAPRKWEPEPLRWLGVHSMYHLYHMADLREARSSGVRTSRFAHLADLLTGH